MKIRKHMSNEFFGLIYQLWKYFSTCKTIRSFTSYLCWNKTYSISIVTTYIAISVLCFMFFHILLCFIFKSTYPHRHHFTCIIIHAMGTPIIKHFNTFSEYVVSPLVSVQISLLFSSILVLWRTLTSSAESHRMSQEALHWLYGRICIQSSICAEKLTENKWCC